MQKTVKYSLLALASLLSISMLSAKSFSDLKPAAAVKDGLAINIIQQNQEQVSGNLINADASYFVFENPADESVQVIPRAEVQVLETNKNVNLFEIFKSKHSDSLSDQIELNDGTHIACIILDIGSERVQYFTGQSLKRQVVSVDNIYNVQLDHAAVAIPFPALATPAPAI